MSPLLPRLFALCALAIFSTSISGLAESLAHSERAYWTKCRHTAERIARGLPCRCGCTKAKKAKPVVKLLDGHGNCDADDVVAHAPQFTKLVGSLVRGLIIDSRDGIGFFVVLVPLRWMESTLAVLKPG